MTIKIKVLTAITIAILAWGGLCGSAQTPTQQDINKLKDEIQRRELVDRDETILPEDKEVNRANLEKARASLRVALQAQIDAKKKLKSLLGPSMTAAESQSADAALQKLEAELEQLQAGRPSTSSSSPPALAAPNEPASQPAASNGAPVNNGAPAFNEPARNNSNRTVPLNVTGAPPPPVLSTADKVDVLPIRKCSDVQQSLASASNLEKYFCGRVAVIQRDKHATPNSISGLDLRRDFFFFMITLLAREGRAQYVVAAENERVDKQAGSDASGSGTTSLVTKGSAASIIATALDSGGLLKSLNGSTLSLRGNLVGLAKAIAARGFITGFDEDSPVTRFFRRTSFGFGFDPSRLVTTGLGVVTGNKQQISNFSFRFDVYNKRDSRQPRYKRDWDNFLAHQSEALVAQIQTSLLALTDPSTNTWNDPALQDWYVLANNAIRGADGIDQIDAVLRDQLNKAPTNLDSTTLAELRNFDKRFKAWLDERERILDKIAKAPIVTFEYTNDRPQNATSLSRFNFIGEGGFGPRLDLTFNGSITIFNTRPVLPNQGRVRDFQFAGQFDLPFGEVGLGLGKPVLSFAGRYERLMADATTAVGTFAPNTRGDIGVGQVKLTIPVKNSGIRIPLSFSFSNRTELIKEKETRGNFGFTFDPDTLFAIFKPFSRRQ
jgi:hypothetical protein